MNTNTIQQFFQLIWRSFPVQLMATNLKKNQIILLFWVFLFGFILFDWGKLFGVPYLFLDPEYHSTVDAQSLFVLGLAFGVFNSSFQITCYIIDSERFQFLSRVKNPIYRFIINNSFLPFIYLVSFCWRFWNFQVDRGLEDPLEAVLECLAFVGGFFWIFILTLFYFKICQSRQLRNVAKILDQKLRNLRFYRLSLFKRIRSLRGGKTKVGHFFGDWFSIKEAKESMVAVQLLDAQQVFSSNHFAAVFLELFTIFVLLFFGAFSDSAIFQIPAGASLFLLFGFILMFIGAISFWLRGWSISIFIGLAIFINLLFSTGVLERNYHALGINYGKKVVYTQARIHEMANASTFVSDSLLTVQILNRWKQKLKQERPKMIFICTSGGGIRSATWTMRTLQYVDSCLKSRLMDQTTLITGASGGLLGAAYYRELFLQSKIQTNVDYYERKYISNMSKDMLNPVVFSLISNDILIRTNTYSDGKYTYHADRGLVFEQTLHQNLNNALNKSLYHYKNPERDALIPMMLVAPVIVNDGRRLYISPQPMSYMTWDKNNTNSFPNFQLLRGIEMGRFFDSCDAMRLNFASALRMNATFPYITPNVSLPTVPSIEVMDGGLSDNFGVSDALRFIHTFKSWIGKETGGVVLLCIRDTPKERPFRKKNFDSWFSRILNPVGSIYSNWARNQDTNNDMQEEYLTHSLKVPLDVLTFQYLVQTDLVENTDESKVEGRASLSWHLTTFEKKSIESAILNSQNQAVLDRLRLLLNRNATENEPIP